MIIHLPQTTAQVARWCKILNCQPNQFLRRIAEIESTTGWDKFYKKRLAGKKPLPCPRCGKRSGIVFHSWKRTSGALVGQWFCPKCNYSGPLAVFKRSDLIAMATRKWDGC